MRRVFAAALVLVVSPVVSWAQIPIKPGDRIRVTATPTLARAWQRPVEVGLPGRPRYTVQEGPSRLAGVVVSLGDSTLIVETAKRGRIEVPLQEAARLEISKGRSHTKGLWVGALTGAAVGLAVFAIGEPSYAFAGPILGAPLGLVVGGIVGAGDRWEDVPLDTLHFSVGPVRGRGMAAAVSVTF
jgi:hypothetical protein